MSGHAGARAALGRRPVARERRSRAATRVGRDPFKRASSHPTTALYPRAQPNALVYRVTTEGLHGMRIAPHTKNGIASLRLCATAVRAGAKVGDLVIAMVSKLKLPDREADHIFFIGIATDVVPGNLYHSLPMYASRLDTQVYQLDARGKLVHSGHEIHGPSWSSSWKDDQKNDLLVTNALMSDLTYDLGTFNKPAGRVTQIMRDAGIKVPGATDAGFRNCRKTPVTPKQVREICQSFHTGAEADRYTAEVAAEVAAGVAAEVADEACRTRTTKRHRHMLLRFGRGLQRRYRSNARSALTLAANVSTPGLRSRRRWKGLF